LLLPPAAQIRFVVTDSTSVDSRNSGQVSLTYRAWDQSSGTAGVEMRIGILDCAIACELTPSTPHSATAEAQAATIWRRIMA
jgi:hypothetical protein